MRLAFLLSFLAIPVIEIAVFIQVGGWIGLGPTIALILLTAVLGTWQLRQQGLATLNRARQQMDRGEVPTRELFDGLCLLAAGALLLTPGFVTDIAGAALFLPPVRAWLRRRLGGVLAARAHSGAGMQTRVFIDGEEVSPGAGANRPRPGAQPGATNPHSPWRRGGTRGAPTIEGEWTEVHEDAGEGTPKLTSENEHTKKDEGS